MLLPFVSYQDLHGWLMPIFVYFYKVYINTLALCQNLKDSAPIFSVPLLIFDVLNLPEEAPKFPENFLPFFRRFPEGVRCLFLMDSHPCPIFTFNWVLCYLGSFLVWLSSTSLEGVPKFSADFLSLSRLRKLLSFSFRPIFSVVSDLVTKLPI